MATDVTRHDLEAKIVKRCWTDDAFRREFLADPAAAFTKYLNVPKGDMPKVVVHEEAVGTWHIVLPAKPAAGVQLSDDELERVAGGAGLGVGSHVLMPDFLKALTKVTCQPAMTVRPGPAGW